MDKRIVAFYLFVSLQVMTVETNSASEQVVPVMLTTRSGVSYTGISSIKVEPDGITVSHEAGVSKIRLYDLPDELITKYNLNKEDAEEYKLQQKEMLRAKRVEMLQIQEARQRKMLLSKLEVERGFQSTGTIFQVVPGKGILYKGFRTEEYMDTKQIEDGSLSNQTTDPLVKKRMKAVNVKRTRSLPIGDAKGNLSFIVCSTKGLVDNDSVSQRLYPFGTYSYATTINATATVPCYTPDFQAFVQFIESGEASE